MGNCQPNLSQSHMIIVPTNPNLYSVILLKDVSILIFITKYSMRLTYNGKRSKTNLNVITSNEGKITDSRMFLNRPNGASTLKFCLSQFQQCHGIKYLPHGLTKERRTQRFRCNKSKCIFTFVKTIFSFSELNYNAIVVLLCGNHIT